MYKGLEQASKPLSEDQCIHFPDGEGDDLKAPILFHVKRPDGPDGKERDQTLDAAAHMRYAKTLNLPELFQFPRPRFGRAIIVGGAPSIKDHLEEIRELSKDPRNAIFAINWTHTWLINNGIIPRGCVFFEIDAEPATILENAHPDCTYFICCHCHPKTFDMLKGYKRVLWHTHPNSDLEDQVHNEIFPNSHLCGGGIYTFTRSITVAMFLGYRHFDIFGCDSSFPDDGNTHVEGYETVFDAKVDGMFVYAQNSDTKEVRRFKTTGALALQVQEFVEYCKRNHQFFSLRVYGDSLLRFSHEMAYPEQYADR